MQHVKVKKTATASDGPITGEIRWTNNGSAFYGKNGKKIGHGETFFATPDDVPLAFRDLVRPVDPAALLAVEKSVTEVVKSGLKLQQRGDTLFYDILDANNKRINEEDLSEQEAKQVLEILI